MASESESFTVEIKESIDNKSNQSGGFSSLKEARIKHKNYKAKQLCEYHIEP